MTEQIRIVVADDEPIARVGLCNLLSADPEVAVVASCSDGAATVKALRELQPDVVFLDVQMPVLDGFGVLREIEAEYVPVVIFVTAYDHYALKAFDVHALDYLLKPFENERFRLALSRAKERVRTPNNNDTRQPSESADLSARLARFLDYAEQRHSDALATHPARIVVRSDGRIRFVRTAELLWIEAADYYVKLHTPGKVHMLRESMASLERRLDPAVFFRVNRSAIVNLDYVREIQPFAQGEHVVVLNDGTKTRLTPSRREALAEKLGERL